MSVARRSPTARREAAARLELKPWRQTTITSTSGPVASGIRQAPAGSSRHSRTVRSMTIAPGRSPCVRRWASVRVSTSSAPRATAAAVSRGVSRSSSARLAASTSSTPTPRAFQRVNCGPQGSPGRGFRLTCPSCAAHGSADHGDYWSGPSSSDQFGVTMIILGLILLILGLLVPAIHVLLWIGVIVLVIGLVLALAGSTGRAIGGRRHYW